MPTINFQTHFAPLVESGRKTQTIRATRKRPIRVGDALFLYVGLRRPGARLLKKAVCTEALNIKIGGGGFGDEIEIAGRKLTTPERAALARADGFGDATELLDWFLGTHGLPFEGQVIRWE